MLGDGGIVEKHLEQRFVISFQRDEVRRERIAHEAVEHPARIRPSINVVAERDRHAVADWTRVEVARNVVDHAVEQIRPAMNVADDVNSRPIEDNRMRNCDHGRRSPEWTALFYPSAHSDVAASMTVSRSLPWFDRNQS